MGEKVSKYNKPIDRDYFKRKENPDWDAEKKVTPCCNQDVDYDGLNVFNEEHWERIEKHIQEHLHDYPHTETMTPVSCDECGRLLEYVCTLNEDSWTPSYLRKGKK